MTTWTREDVYRAITAAIGVAAPEQSVDPRFADQVATVFTRFGVAPNDPRVATSIRTGYAQALQTNDARAAAVCQSVFQIDAAVLAARDRTSRRPRAPDEITACVLPWLNLRDPAWCAARDAVERGVSDVVHLLSGVHVASMRFCTAWAETQQVFRLSPAFADMLARTEIKGVNAADFATPYDNFWIAIPGCEEQIDDTVCGGTLALTGIGVSVSPAGVLIGDPAHGVPVRLVEGPTLTLLTWAAAPEHGPRGDDVLRGFQIPLGVYWAEDPEAALALVFGEDDASNLAQYEFRVVSNLLLYLNADNPEVASGAENAAWAARRRQLGASRKPKKRRQHAAVPTFTVTDIAPSISGQSTASEARGGPRRHWVRGHWTRQPYGPHGSLRKLLWIRPFLRGGDAGDEVPPRVYVGP